MMRSWARSRDTQILLRPWEKNTGGNLSSTLLWEKSFSCARSSVEERKFCSEILKRFNVLQVSQSHRSQTFGCTRDVVHQHCTMTYFAESFLFALLLLNELLLLFISNLLNWNIFASWWKLFSPFFLFDGRLYDFLKDVASVMRVYRRKFQWYCFQAGGIG